MAPFKEPYILTPLNTLWFTCRLAVEFWKRKKKSSEKLFLLLHGWNTYCQSHYTKFNNFEICHRQWTTNGFLFPMIYWFGRSHRRWESPASQELPRSFPSPRRRSVLHRGGGSRGFHTAGWSAQRGQTCLAPRLSRLRWSALGGCATAGSRWSSCPVWRMWRAVWKETHVGRSTVGTKTEEEEEATFGTQTLGGTRRKYGRTLQVQTGTEGIFH